MHYHANAAETRVEDGARDDESLRSPVGTAQRTPPATSGGAFNHEEHVGRTERIF